ncbi:MAG: septum site-determining protein MinC [Ruminococcaceae bacterium]|nr:septum site-determining protein MinC [Oscillospiraceae bacterium]
MAEKKELLTLKLYKNGMVVYINENATCKEVEEALVKKFEESKTFFKGVKKIGFKGTPLTNEEYKSITDKISDVLKDSVEFWENPETPEKTTEEKVKEAINAKQILDRAMSVEAEDEYTKFYKKTLRSGQLLESDGNIVIVGDVNPGAEVIAEGNIFVMGTVKGLVHAGKSGNREAVVVALNLSPTQLRIADLITRSPEGENKDYLSPELAYIKEDKIFIEEFLQKRK